MTYSLRLLLAAAFILAMGTVSTYPTAAEAQSPSSEEAFNRRMASRIDIVQMRIRSLRKDLEGGEDPQDRSRSGGYDTGSGARNRLDAMDEQCLELERQLRRMQMGGVGPSYETHEQQRLIEYNVYVLERQVLDLERWIQPAQKDADEPPQDTPAQPEEPEDGISDEEWAEDWAKGGD